MKKPRKPRPIINQFDIGRLNAPLPDDVLDELQIMELSALKSITQTTASVEDWYCLFSMVCLCEMLSHQGIGPEALPSCTNAKAALIFAMLRNESTGRFGLTREGIVAIRDVFEYADLQRRSIPGTVYGKLVDKAARSNIVSLNIEQGLKL